MRFVLPLIAAVALACTAAQDVSAAPAPISNSDLHRMYYGAPLITNHQAKAIPLGITRRQLTERLHGRSANDSGAHSYFDTWKVCVVYPVKGTGVRYADGFVSADDGEVIELSQYGFEQKPFHRAVAELGGYEAEDTDHMVTESLIRGMYAYWRKVMED